MSLIDMELMKQELIRDEGSVDHAYQDSLGLWTIGVGRLIDIRKNGKLYQDEIELLLSNDIQKCLLDIAQEPWFQSLESDNQKRALVNMRFQLGSMGIRNFQTFLACLTRKDWNGACDALRHSKWYTQTPNRVERIIAQFQNQT